MIFNQTPTIRMVTTRCYYAGGSSVVHVNGTEGNLYGATYNQTDNIDATIRLSHNGDN